MTRQMRQAWTAHFGNMLDLDAMCARQRARDPDCPHARALQARALREAASALASLRAARRDGDAHGGFDG